MHTRTRGNDVLLDITNVDTTNKRNVGSSSVPSVFNSKNSAQHRKSLIALLSSNDAPTLARAPAVAALSTTAMGITTTARVFSEPAQAKLSHTSEKSAIFGLPPTLLVASPVAAPAQSSRQVPIAPQKQPNALPSGPAPLTASKPTTKAATTKSSKTTAAASNRINVAAKAADLRSSVTVGKLREFVLKFFQSKNPVAVGYEQHIIDFLFSDVVQSSFDSWLHAFAFLKVISLFEQCGQLKLAMFENLIFEWSKWRQSSLVIDTYLRLFFVRLDAQVGPQAPRSVLLSLKGSSVFGWLLDAVFAAFRSFLGVELQDVVVMLTSDSFSIEVNNDTHQLDPSIRKCAVRLGGALLFRRFQSFESRGNLDACAILDLLSIRQDGLEPEDCDIFLRSYNAGFLRFPRPALLVYFIEVLRFVVRSMTMQTLTDQGSSALASIFDKVQIDPTVVNAWKAVATLCALPVDATSNAKETRKAQLDTVRRELTIGTVRFQGAQWMAHFNSNFQGDTAASKQTQRAICKGVAIAGAPVHTLATSTTGGSNSTFGRPSVSSTRRGNCTDASLTTSAFASVPVVNASRIFKGNSTTQRDDTDSSALEMCFALSTSSSSSSVEAQASPRALLAAMQWTTCTDRDSEFCEYGKECDTNSDDDDDECGNNENGHQLEQDDVWAEEADLSNDEECFEEEMEY